MTLDDLKQKHLEAVRANRAAERAAAAYNLALAEYLEEREALPGYAVDLFGDGQIKPLQACAAPGGKGGGS